jgi:hypothetical protein
MTLMLKSLPAKVRHVLSIERAVELCLFLQIIPLVWQYLSCPDWEEASSSQSKSLPHFEEKGKEI